MDIDATTGECPLDQEEPGCNFCHIFVLTSNIITFLLVPSAINGLIAIVPIAVALLLALGGFFIFSSAGNPGRLEQGKKIITATVVGLLIIYGSWVFINLLLSAMGVAEWTGLGTWWEVECGTIPFLSFNAESLTIFVGESTNLLWTVGGVSSCEASGDWSGDKSTVCDPFCSETITPPMVLDTYSYSLKCTGLGGVVRGSVSVNVINRPPTVAAGPDQSVALAAGASLDGTVTDDGFPVPPASVTTTWTMTSGPGTVTFGNPFAVDTTAAFSTSGTYVLKLTADDGGDQTSDEVEIAVIPPPIAGISALPPSGGAPLSVTFTDASTGGPIDTWSWSFGDGTTSSAENPGTHTYTLVDTYIVTLAVTGFGGLDTVTATIEVTPMTFTTDSDFDKGTILNLVQDPSNQLQLDPASEAFGFIWVPVSTKGTVVKIDTSNGAVLGEYRTGPQTVGSLNPSRTTVDNNKDVWVTNRDDDLFVPADAIAPGLPAADESMGSVTHIGLEENSECVDRNGNGVIDTSVSLGDIKGWDSALSGADDFGGVSTAEDECIIHYVRITSTGARHLSVTANNDVWASGSGERHFDLIDGDTGTIIRQEPSVGAGGYGGLIDANGVLWSSLGGNLLRWDTSLPLASGNYTVLDQPGTEYGLCIDSFGNVWTSHSDDNIIDKYDPSGSLLGSFPETIPALTFNTSPTAQGCVVDNNDDVWIAHSWTDGRTVGHLKNDGTYVGSVDLGEAAAPTGVAVDSAGKIWATGYDTQKVYRIDPGLGAIGGDGVTPIGAVDLVSVPLGGNLYNYSDMTGSTLTGAVSDGAWTVIYDSGIPGAQWGTVTWTSLEPGGSSLEVTAASSTNCSTFGPSQVVANGVDLTVANGQCLRVRVGFIRGTLDTDGDGLNDSPVLFSLVIETQP